MTRKKATVGPTYQKWRNGLGEARPETECDSAFPFSFPASSPHAAAGHKTEAPLPLGSLGFVLPWVESRAAFQI
jgi:hypothetical protein